MKLRFLLVAALWPATATVAVPTPLPPPLDSSAAPMQSTPHRIDPQSDEMVAAAIAGRAMEQDNEQAMLAGLDAALAELPRPTRYRGLIQAYRGTALANAGRMTEARAALEEAQHLLPDIASTSFILGQLLLQQKSLIAGVKLIIRAIEAEPATAEGLPPDFYQTVFRQLRYAREGVLRDQLMLVLVKAGYAARHPDFGTSIAKVAIRARLDADDIAGAAAMLPLMTEPGPVIEMVVNNRYRKLWPAIDLWSGGDLHTMRVATLDAATAGFKSNPEPDLQATLNYADALWQTGNAEAAIKQLQGVLAAPERWDAERIEATGIASHLAVWQFSLGEIDAALETATRFMAITPIVKYPNVVNLMINHAMRLAVLGRGSEALAVLDRAEQQAKVDADFEGEGARLWFDAVRACAASGAAAKPAIARIEARGAAINPSARNQSLACRGDTSALVRIALAELAAADSADLMAVDLRTMLVSDLPILTLSARTWQAVARDPQLTKALDVASRPIPASYVRAANKWRH